MKKLLLILLPLYLFASLQKVSVQLEWKHQFEFAGFYAALEKGYYKDVGLDVQIKEYNKNTDTVNDVLNSVSTYGISSSQLILERLSGKEIVLLASYFKQNALVLITKPSIKSFKDLKGKRVMAEESELKYTSLAAAMLENDISIKDFKLIEHSFSVKPFIDGDVDAMSAFISNQPFLLDQNKTAYNILNPAESGVFSYDVELFTSQKELENHPQRAQNFINATKKGWEYALANKEEIVELIHKKYTKRKSKEALLYEADITHKLMKTDLFQIGAVVPELVELNTNMYNKIGMTSKDWNLDGFIFKQNSKTLNFSQLELEFIKEHPVIRFSDVNWEPFSKVKESEYSGIFREYYKLLEKRTGLKFEFVKIGDGVNFQSVLDALKNKKIDMIDGSGKSQDRKNYALFAGPIMQVSLAIVSNEKNNFNSLTDLKDKTLSVAKGSTASEYIKEHFPDIKLIYTNSINEALKLVSENRADAVVDNLVVLDYIINNNTYFSQLKLKNLNNYDFNIYAMVRNDYQILQKILTNAIKSITQEELFQINNKLLLATIKNSPDSNIINLTKKEKEYIQNKKSIKMCIDPNWLPFEKIDNKKHIGVTADYFKIIEKYLDTSIELVPTSSWSESIEYAKQRKCDIFSLAMETQERKKYMNFTSPYIKGPLVLATKSEVPFIVDIENLKNKKIGIPKDYSAKEVMQKKYSHLTIVDVNDVKEGLRKVSDGELFGFIGTLPSIGYVMHKEFAGELKIASKFDESWELSIAVRNDDITLLNILQKALNSVDDTQVNSILNKWVYVKYEKGVDYTLVWQILFIFLLMLLSFIFWNRKLSLLNKELKIAKDRADEATKAKASFLANMSHEIRTPMNSIIGMSYLVKETKLNKIQYDYIQKIETSSNNLLKLINDILDFSKLEVKKLEIKKVNFNLLELVNNIENILKIETMEKSLEFKITYDKSMPMQLYGDSLRLSQVLTNLLSNAVKFTEKGKIELKIEQKDNIYKFIVSDTGIGLTDTQMKNIFLSFTQADSSITRKYGGSGLGLSIAKELVHIMGGEIFVESVFGKGSTFYFEIELENSNIKTNLSSAQDETKENSSNITNKTDLQGSKSKELFNSLKIATKKRRPQLCEPILKEIEEYNLDEETQKLFINAKNLIKSYKFDEAWRLLDEE